jgi:hypothetical protein
MSKYITVLIILLLSIGSVGLVSAGEIVKEDGATIYIYGAIEDTIYMSAVNDGKTNFNRTVCINSAVIEGEIQICGDNNYELEYTFIADINDTDYVSRILIIKQECINKGWLSGKSLNRTLSLDGTIIGNYESKIGWFGKPKKHTVYFDLLDNNIRYGNDIIINESLAFTQLNYIDQQSYLTGVTDIYPSFPIYHKYISINYNNESSGSGLELSGLTGIFYNVFGDNILTKIPLVGSTIASFGKSIQSLLFLPLTIIQFSFNIIFSFLNVLINNWWYSILLLEIFCILTACRHTTYPDIVGTYISMHVKIFVFLYEKVILNTVNLIMRIIEIIRNMFRI